MSSDANVIFVFGGIIWGLCITLMWIYIAWRGMEAHERIARALMDIAKETSATRKNQIESKSKT